jgi:methionyl-tRNA formyltransferase
LKPLAEKPLKVIFAGTPEFARVALQCIHAAGAQIVLVLSQPDRPAGRGMKLQASSVKQFAVAHMMPVAQPAGLRLDGKYAADAAAARDAILAADADVMVVAAYGLILPQWVLDAMQAPRANGSQRLGCLNIHGSLLPRWRGAAPIHRAIEAGDTQTGVTIMQMDVGLDTGDMLLQQALPIAADDTTASLHDKVAALGADMVVQALVLAQQQGLVAQKQPAEGVSYAHKIEKHEAAIDWTHDAASICRRVQPLSRRQCGAEWRSHQGLACHRRPGRGRCGACGNGAGGGWGWHCRGRAGLACAAARTATPWRQALGRSRFFAWFCGASRHAL